MGFLDIPKVNHCAGLVLLIVNCIFPGIDSHYINQIGFGTMIGGLINNGGCDCCIVLCGVIQLLTAPFIIGWVWSIIWGCRMWTSYVCYKPIQREAYTVFSVISKKDCV